MQHITTMSRYNAEFPFPVAFPPQAMTNVLAEWLGKKGVKQAHIAGTLSLFVLLCVTFFFCRYRFLLSAYSRFVIPWLLSFVHHKLSALFGWTPFHRIIPPHRRRHDPDLLLLDVFEERFRVGRGGAGRGVASVAEEVDVDVRDADFFRGFEEGVEVVDVRVDAAVGYL